MYFCGPNMKPRAFDLKLKIHLEFHSPIYDKDMTGFRSLVRCFITFATSLLRNICNYLN